MSQQTEFCFTQDIPKKIIFHEDFDGICSAALLKKFFGVKLDLEPVSYKIKNRWLRRNVLDAAVADFLYHPQAIWWFDHHETSFLNDKLRKDYKPDTRHRWGISYPSCPSLIIDVLSESTDISWLRNFFCEWVHWSDIVDSGNYKNPAQAIYGKEPYILINQALSEEQDPRLRCFLVERISEGIPPLEIVNDSYVSPLWKKFQEKQSKALSYIKDRLRIVEKVALCNLLDLDTPFIRYGIYLFAEEVPYTIMAYKTKYGLRKYTISISKNPWLKNNTREINLGIIAKKYGGGGRTMVGSVSFIDPKICWDAAEKITKTLNEYLSMGGDTIG